MTPKTNSPFNYGIDRLTPSTALALAGGSLRGQISEEVRFRLVASQKHVQEIVNRNISVYGINTGFGPLCRTCIAPEDTGRLQENILRSHSVGVGEPVSKEIAKLMLILKAHSLCQGFSGVSLALVERILWHIEKDIIPVVPSQGSVGASGDLAPLAHLFLPLIGLGQVFYKDKIIETAKSLEKTGIKGMALGPKEGLALINGTQFIAAHAVKIVERLHNCLECADIIGALSLESMLGSVQPFKHKLHQLRPFNGALHVAHRLRTLLEGSEVLGSHKNCERVQDPYSLRCMPQVHGTSRDAWEHLACQVLTEINAVTDNPVIFSSTETVSGGNFHGQPLALPLDYTAMAASELGNISERRTYLLLEGKEGLPVLLMKDTGINSGFMIPQYTAAALVSENKSLCFPASVDSIPTSLGQEDHVSMGAISARKTLRVVDNLEKILAIELLCAAQAFDFRRPLKSSHLLEACHDLVRQKISHADDDRVFGDDIKIAIAILTKGELDNTANNAAKQKRIDLKGDLHERFRLS
ncbi:MAG: histidine ammonia-lyase [Deltaproteobacteria bacterium]|nr:histidine ammonia-lyase [Deltaproteobacteria bacterium]